MEERRVNGNLERLEYLTNNLPSLVSLARKVGNKVTYDIEIGNCLGFNLYRDLNVAIQRSFMPKDSLFQTHSHGEIEVLGIISGLAEITIENTVYIMSQYKTIIINPEIQHSVRALEDTWLWGVTMPPEDGYPDDDNR